MSEERKIKPFVHYCTVLYSTVQYCTVRVKPNGNSLKLIFSFPFTRLGRACLGDLGETQHIDKPKVVSAGSHFYVAPEVIRGEGIALASDIFSMAVLLLECGSYYLEKAYLKKRWRDGEKDLPIQVAFGNVEASESKSITERMAKKAWRPAVPPELRCHWPGLCNLIERCWDHDPKARPTAGALAAELSLLEKDRDHIAKDKLLGAPFAVGDREQLAEYRRLCAVMDSVGLE